VTTAPPQRLLDFAGSWTPEGNQMARRDNADPSGLGNTLGWAWAWPLNRRILYNRASADPQGIRGIKTSAPEMGRGEMGRMDIPTTAPPHRAADVGPFIMQPEGMGRLFAIDKMAEGPFPNTTSRLKRWGTNPLHPNVISNPAARVFKGDAEALGKADKFPYVGTTYRLTALPLLDQACAAQRHRTAGTVCGNRREAGE
jgi:formate dehydrogenase major subunit